MPCQLLADCLDEIFEYLEDDVYGAPYLKTSNAAPHAEIFNTDLS